MSELYQFLARCKEDPVFFANSLLVKKTRGIIDGQKLRHAGQEDWLRNSNQPINTLVPGNRWGKSTIEGIKHLWKGFTKDGVRLQGLGWFEAPYESISISISADQAGIVYKVVKELARSPAFRPFVARTRETPFPHVVLWNGSIIHCRSAHDDGKYIDGHGYQYISIDEAGWFGSKLKQLMNGVILMRLAGGGDIDLVGTPKGFGDLYWYYERGLRGVPGYYSQRGSIFDNPFLPPEDLKMRDELLRSSDPKLRMQVMYGEFVDFAGLAFTHDQRDNAFRTSLPAHQDPIDGHRYVQAWDLGRQTDFTVGVTLDVTARPFILVDYVRLNHVPWEEIYRLIGERKELYGVVMPRIDATGPAGDVIEEELWKRGIGVEGYKTSTRMEKLDLINNLQQAFDYKRLTVGERMEPDEAGVLHRVPVMDDPDPEGDTWGLLRLPAIPQLMDELGTYQLDDKDIVQDSVIALALATDLAYSGEFIGEAVEGGLYG